MTRLQSESRLPRLGRNERTDTNAKSILQEASSRDIPPALPARHFRPRRHAGRYRRRPGL
ncbi:hypothetical protein AGR4B_Cc60689 [Agrobacterium tumefaciens str. CFBP 5621]|nr:hypothetical protein AGR4B_Cc60689 [Agrobacterium tumefaciens str. CFBP 5621]